jgi:hypothetical protein
VGSSGTSSSGDELVGPARNGRAAQMCEVDGVLATGELGVQRRLHGDVADVVMERDRVASGVVTQDLGPSVGGSEHAHE